MGGLKVDCETGTRSEGCFYPLHVMKNRKDEPLPTSRSNNEQIGLIVSQEHQVQEKAKPD